jgi:hypothetical protein
VPETGRRRMSACIGRMLGPKRYVVVKKGANVYTPQLIRPAVCKPSYILSSNHQKCTNCPGMDATAVWSRRPVGLVLEALKNAFQTKS